MQLRRRMQSRRREGNEVEEERRTGQSAELPGVPVEVQRKS